MAWCGWVRLNGRNYVSGVCVSYIALQESHDKKNGKKPKFLPCTHLEQLPADERSSTFEFFFCTFLSSRVCDILFSVLNFSPSAGNKFLLPPRHIYFLLLFRLVSTLLSGPERTAGTHAPCQRAPLQTARHLPAPPPPQQQPPQPPPVHGAEKPNLPPCLI